MKPRRQNSEHNKFGWQHKAEAYVVLAVWKIILVGLASEQKNLHSATVFLSFLVLTSKLHHAISENWGTGKMLMTGTSNELKYYSLLYTEVYVSIWTLG